MVQQRDHSKPCGAFENDIISVGTYVFSLQAFLFMMNPILEESLHLFYNSDNLFSHSGRILHLWNDFGTTQGTHSYFIQLVIGLMIGQSEV